MANRQQAVEISYGTRCWIVASLALAVLPHAVRVSAWITLAVVAVGAVQLLTRGRGHRTLPAWLVGLLVVAGSTAVLLQYGTLAGQEAGLALLVLLLPVKLLELRSRRDVALVIHLCWFAAVTHALFVETLGMALYMLFSVLVSTAALIQATHPDVGRTARDNVRLAAALVGQAFPLAVVLFVLFPRVPGILWTVPEAAQRGVTGLSSTMSVGDISRLALSGKVAFRVAFDGPPPPPAERYWRGPVFWYTDGRTWSGGPAWQQQMLNLRPSPHRYDLTYAGPEIHQTITLEPHRERWLFALDLAREIPDLGYAANDVQWLTREPVMERARYRAVSVTDFAIRSPAVQERRRSLQVPAGVSPRAGDLAASWRAASSNEQEVLERALDFFRRSGFGYTLTPPPAGRDPVDEFLFETREGFCEHFAAAFTLLMRLAGVPARVVTGYMGGELNPLGEYMIVRQSHAHAWSEVWLRDRGWIRVDPTIAASPARLDHSEIPGLATIEGALRYPLFNSRFLRTLRYGADAVNNAWNQWVLGYGPKLQTDLMQRAGWRNPTWRKMALAMLILSGLVVFLTGVVMLVRGGRPADPVAAAYRVFCERAARLGVARRPSEGPLDFARRLAEALPDLGAPAAQVTEAYVALRYGKPGGAHTIAALRLRVHRFGG